MSWDTAADLGRLQAAMQVFDKAGVVAFCEDLLARVYAAADPYPTLPATRLLSALRKQRFFVQMERLADAFIQNGSATFSVRRLYAQALLDQGRFTAAQQTLDKLVADTDGQDAHENAEAHGLVGRLYKQMYVNAGAPTLDRTQDWLARSAAAYFGPYEHAPDLHAWHGINVVAVAHRSQRDSVPLKVQGIPLPLTLATSILKKIEQKDAIDTAELFDFGIAVEACLALGKSCDALQWALKYVKDTKCGAFEFGSTLRQLEEVWQLPRPGSAQNMHCEEAILSLLRATVLRCEGGSVSADGASVRAELRELEHTNLEKVFGTDRYMSLDGYRRGLARCAAVARIGRETSRGLGTGFLVRGASLHASLGEAMYLLTNAHVVSPQPETPSTLTPDEAVITFEGLAGAEGQTWRCIETVFSSPIGNLDATLLRLDRPVPVVEAYPIAKRMPPAGGTQRVYVVGHPLGGTLSFSMQDNRLLDCDERRVHYRTPTEQGSSGSPVFNDEWELVALHHAGRSDMRKLHGQPGGYEANEGINILAIRDGLALALQA